MGGANRIVCCLILILSDHKLLGLAPSSSQLTASLLTGHYELKIYNLQLQGMQVIEDLQFRVEPYVDPKSVVR